LFATGTSAGLASPNRRAEVQSRLRASSRAPAKPARSGLDGAEHAGTITEPAKDPMHRVLRAIG
jgi:hypothetical protein